MRVLGYVPALARGYPIRAVESNWLTQVQTAGWAKFMEWKHPNIEVSITDPKTFKAAGAVEAAASL
jgi:hypothetical protein